jgi:carnitine O-acetyltransferase
MKKRPMAMDSYQWMFNASRRPAKPADYPVKFPANENKYILVIRKNQFFKLQHEIDGRQLNTSELKQQFDGIYEKATEAPPIGILTTENRDVWTDAREILLKVHPNNATALAEVEAASFVVCLDEASPVTLTERAKHYLYGNGQNRWFDKPAQFIINDNGTAGFNGEHSMMDGTSTHRLNDYVCDAIFNEKLDFSAPSISSNLPEPSVIEFHVDQDTQEKIDLAQKHFGDRLGKHELTVQAYQGYGKGLIKRFKFSPDAYVQLIIQLAYYKMFGKSQPTYESVMTRRFQQGRTEVCRSVSDQSIAFCKAMSDPSSNSVDVIALFRNAIKSHVQYLNVAADGKGVERHLFGLKKLLRADEETPDIFRDPAYAYSSTWVLSTSQLSSEYLNGFGWSQVVDHGFGIAYMINENR